MANLCGRNTNRGCPASLYMKCEGYAKGLNCWEMKKKPCCSVDDLSICSACKVYINCHEQARAAYTTRLTQRN